MKSNHWIIALLTLTTIFINSSMAQQPEQKLAGVFNGKNRSILVAAHRGDWRNAPENSLKGLTNSIEKGFDIVELDVKLTKDSQLVVMHDEKIDRTTNGKGKVSDYTFDELKKLRLKNGLGRITDHAIPTLKEMMVVAKGKIIINVDKGDDYLPAVFKVLSETGTTAQTIVNVSENTVYQKMLAEKSIPKSAYLMVIADMKKPGALERIAKYKGQHEVVIQPIFNSDTLSNLKMLPQLADKQVLWLNSLWPSLNGGHDDDRAVELQQPNESWGWLIEMKPKIIQSDRPIELIEYLRKNKLHQ